jgi:hypothetical protein
MSQSIREIHPGELRLPPESGRLNLREGSAVSASDIRADLFSALQELSEVIPEMRIGQFLATVGMLGEDDTGRSLWDIEDEELAAALERFARDVSRRNGA